MAAWSKAQHRKFKATMAERAFLRDMKQVATHDKSPVVLSQRIITTEVKVGSEIAFTLGDMRLIIKAVE